MNKGLASVNVWDSGSLKLSAMTLSSLGVPLSANKIENHLKTVTNFEKRDVTEHGVKFEVGSNEVWIYW